MPITQQYKINTPDAYEGMIYGLRTAMTIRTVVAEAQGGFDANGNMHASQLEYGRPVKLAAVQAGKVPVVDKVAKTAAGESCYGILVRQINHEAATRPSVDGKMAIMVGDQLGMLVEGEIMVKLSAAVKANQQLAFDPAGAWKKDTNNYSNVVALQNGAAGDLIPARIFSVTPAPVVS